MRPDVMRSIQEYLVIVIVIWCIVFNAAVSSHLPNGGAPRSVTVHELSDDVSRRTLGSDHQQRSGNVLLRLDVESEPNPIILNLTLSPYNSDQTPVFVSRENGTSTSTARRWTPPNNKSFSVYQDPVHGAAILLRSQTTSDGDVTRVYRGCFRHGKHDYVLMSSSDADSDSRRRRRRRRRSSSDSDLTSQSLGDKTAQYVAYKQDGSDAPSGTPDTDVTGSARPYRDEWARLMSMPLAASSAATYIVDVLMVIDYAIYKSWVDASLERTDADKRQDAINSIHEYYVNIANGMDLRYTNIKDDEFAIRIRLIGIYIATTAADSSWTEGPSIKVMYNGDAYTISSPSLAAFQTWLANDASRLGLPSCDQATLFTGNLLMSGYTDGKPTVISGLGNIEGMCSERRVTVNQEWGEFATTGTATHELGHNLGALHDGQSNNSCNSTSQYIMATSPGALNVENFLHPYNFSTCSIEYFRQYLRRLNTQHTNCMLNATTDFDPSLVNYLLQRPPGQFLPVDKQCQLIYGPNSFYCAGANNDARLCTSMACYDTTQKKCVARAEQRAASGTTCGNHTWCQFGSCVHDDNAPQAFDSCLSGDSREPFGDGKYCSTKIKEDPSICYNDNKTCCRSCQLVRALMSDDCPYGDRSVTYCQQAGTNCLDAQIQAQCCATCPKQRMVIPGCAYGDQASWCSTIYGSLCYSGNTSSTCCQTCFQWKAIGFPGCEYGNKASWCRTTTQDKCAESQSTRETCCLLCSSRNVTGIDPACQDAFGWCSKLAPSYCYASDKKCCKTCKAFSTGMQGCEYGDRYDWCEGTVRIEDCKSNKSEVIDNCCGTCYRLSGVTRPTTIKPKSSSSSRGVACWLCVTFAVWLLYALGVSQS